MAQDPVLTALHEEEFREGVHPHANIMDRGVFTIDLDRVLTQRSVPAEARLHNHDLALRAAYARLQQSLGKCYDDATGQDPNEPSDWRETWSQAEAMVAELRIAWEDMQRPPEDVLPETVEDKMARAIVGQIQRAAKDGKVRVEDLPEARLAVAKDVLQRVVDRFWEPSEDNDALLAEVEGVLGDHGSTEMARLRKIESAARALSEKLRDREGYVLGGPRFLAVEDTNLRAALGDK